MTDHARPGVFLQYLCCVYQPLALGSVKWNSTVPSSHEFINEMSPLGPFVVLAGNGFLHSSIQHPQKGFLCALVYFSSSPSDFLRNSASCAAERFLKTLLIL